MVSQSISKLGIIAGGGMLPAILAAFCKELGIEPFIVALKGQADPDLLNEYEGMSESIGKAGYIIKTLQKENVQDLVLIGSIRRPSLSELKPDLKTAGFFARIGVKTLGDSNILSLLKAELEGDGFKVHGIQDFVGGLLAGDGALGRYKPDKSLRHCIDHGVKISQEIGRIDIGQSVVIQNDLVLGVEGVEGTDELVRRCASYARKGGAGPILVKTCKPGQDHTLDLPTIGLKTIQNCVESGYAGVVIHAGHTLLVEKKALIDYADQNKIFLWGVLP